MQNISDILCDLTIDVAMIVKEAKSFTQVAYVNGKIKVFPFKFMNRVDSVVDYCYQMYDDDNMTDEKLDELMINLMYTLVNYKKSYHEGAYAYKVMNSLLDAVKESFVSLH